MKIKKNIAVSDTGFVFNPSSGESFNVNPLGMELLTYLKEDHDYEFIKNAIIKNYNTDDASFERDYNDFMSMLQQYNLIEN